MTTFYLIRHGETAKNIANNVFGQDLEEPITDCGKLQAKSLGQYLSSRVVFDKVYCSSYKRARETCEIVLGQFANKEPYDYNIAFELREYSPGDWKDKKHSEMLTPEIKSKMDILGMNFKFPKGETYFEVQQRAMGWLYDTCLRTQTNEKIAIFSHGMTIKCMLQLMMSFDHRMNWRITIDNTSFSIVEFKDYKWFIKSINNTPHLVNQL